MAFKIKFGRGGENMKRGLEWTALFVAGPAVIAFGFDNVTVRSLFLPLVVIPAAVWLYNKNGFTGFWFDGDSMIERRQLKKVLQRFTLIAAAVIMVTLAAAPDKLLYLPRHAPLSWGLFIVVYILLSVYPQELFYRTFFFQRYRRLFQHPAGMVAVNAAAFGFMHVIFLNGMAVVLSLAAGLLFAETYQKTTSTRLVSLEHALYGMLTFSVGWERYFLRPDHPLLNLTIQW